MLKDRTWLLVLAILILSAFPSACSDDDHIGGSGEPCYDDGSCDYGLSCQDRDLCRAIVIDMDEEFEEECFGDGGCAEGEICVNGECVTEENQ